MKKKIIVTGGLGYIGSHTTIELIKEGYQVIILDSLINTSIEMLYRIEEITGEKPMFYQVDLSDSLALNNVKSQLEGAAGVIHFAALKAVGESTEKPLDYYRNNLFSLINMIEMTRKKNISNFVFSSSATVYGAPESLPLTEASPVKEALSPYGNTKKVGEEILKDLSSTNRDFKVVSLRYFNPIGAHPSGKIGELPNGVPNNLMPFITQTAAGERKELLVFGADYKTPDGTAIRDYIHVEDIAKAHVKTLERLISDKQKANYEVFNLGTGKGYSVLEVINSFEKTTKTKLPYRIVERRNGDVEEMFASTVLANKELNWKATRSLDEMTSSSWYWEKKLRSNLNKK
jgi:UDP-glucose 4-epimerase